MSAIKKNIFLLLLLLPLCMQAQDTGEKKSVTEWLQYMESRYKVQFSYSNTLWNNITFTPIDTAQNLQQQLQTLEQTVPIKIENTAGVYLVLPVRKTAIFKIKDQSNDALVYGVNFRINNGTKHIYFANDAGVFNLPGIFPADSVEFESLFYLTKRVSGQELLRKDAIITLQPDEQLLQEVVVSNYLTEGIETNLNDHSIKLTLNELSTIAGESDGDIFQALKILPGISSPNGKPGSMVLRGSLFSHNQLLFDNIPIYHTGHLFGTLSPYNPDMVEIINVHRNGTPVETGGRVGGTIELFTDKKVVDSLHAGIVLNTVSGSAYIKVPLVKDKLSISLAGRTSYPTETLLPKLKALTVLNAQGSEIQSALNNSNTNLRLDRLKQVFRDANTQLVFQPNKKHMLSVSSIHISDNFEYDFNSVNQNRIETRGAILDNNGLTANWKATWNKKVNTELLLTGSAFFLEEIEQELLNSTQIKNNYAINMVDDLNAVLRGQFKLNTANRLFLGYDIKQQYVWFQELRQEQDTSYKEQFEVAVIHGVYGKHQLLLSDKWISNVGLRANYYTPTNQFYLDPKLGFSFFLNRQFFLKGSVKRTHQFISQRFVRDFDDFKVSNQFWYLAKNDEEVLVGDQAMLGAVYTKLQWTVDVELFAKHTAPIASYRGQGMVSYGDLNTLGADVLVKRRFGKLDCWASYSYAYSTLLLDTASFPFYDQRHMLNLTCIAPIKKWTVSLAWFLGSGLPVLPFEIKGPLSGSPDLFVSAYENRFPWQHQLDMSVTRKFLQNRNRIRGVVSLSVLNVYNKKNIVNQFYSVDNPDNMLRYGIGFAPNLQVKIMW